jgi:uncharacterized membrane protein YadS
VLYLIPITLIASAWMFRSRTTGEAGRRKGGVQIPWFIGGFLLASVLRTYVTPVAEAAPTMKLLATAGLALALFLIGAGISRATLKTVGARPLVQGVILWAFISIAGLLAVRALVG